MKTLKCAAVLLAFIGLLLAGCSDRPQSPVAPVDQSAIEPGSLAKAAPTHFTWEMDPVPGTGVYKGDFPKNPDGKVINRGLQQKCIVQAAIDGPVDLLSGPGDLELNFTAYYSADGSTGEGEFWGKLTLTPTFGGGGVWKMTWHGKGTLSGYAWTVPLTEIGHGNGGALTGMQVRFEHTITVADPGFQTPWHGHADGFIYHY